jgi:predicted acyl esterase
MTSKNTLRDIDEDPDMGLTLSDGTRLSARIWKPSDAGDDPVPVILEYLPYRKRDGTCARDALTHPWFAARGYACVRVDMRGNGDSEGVMEDEYTAQELNDAVEVIHQLAAQPWCNGNVGMMGISWGGFNGLQVAALAPEPLKAIITLCSTVDRYADDIHYKGGNLLNENLGWGATMWAYSSRAPDPALRPDDWRDIWMQRLQNEPFLPAVWLRHQTRDDYWRHGSVIENYAAIKAKVLAVGGWGDAYKNAVPQLVEALPGAKGIVGPWVHKYPHFAVPEPRIGFLQEALRWWDRWLKGAQTGVEGDPDYRAYLMDGVRPATWYTDRPGRWIAEDDGATTHIPVQTLHLSDAGLGPDGTLSAKVRSPHDCGMDAGEYCAIWLGPELPGDQRSDDARSVCFDTGPLAQDMDVVGAPRLHLVLSADRPQAQIAVRVNHVHPDGASTRITYGVLNLSHRDSHAKPAPLIPGQSFDITLDLDHIAYRVPKGHRLRVAISSAYWPMIWPSPETAELTLHSGHLDLPVRPTATKAEHVFEPPTAAAPWQPEELRKGQNRREVTRDLALGTVELRIEDDFGKVRDADHGLIAGSRALEIWQLKPDDPTSARGVISWTEEMERDDIRLRTETSCEMWSDQTTFYLSARLEAYENDTLIYERDVSDAIPRDHM